jgi:hypothetical protein
MDGFNGVLTTFWYLENSGGLKFIHGFIGVLNTLWYLEDLNTFTVLMVF